MPSRGDETADIKQMQKRHWASGDYQLLAASFTIIGEMLCEAADLRAGQIVLDVATGTGNTALAAARRHCRVTGLDFVPSLLEQGRRRARAEGLEIEFIEGDAEDLPFADGSFDVVLSTLGIMFVPDQQKAADELLRVCRPGGKIGIVSWTPKGWAAQFGEIVGKYMHSNGSAASPFEWGCEKRLQLLLGTRARLVASQEKLFLARHLSAQDYWRFFKKATGWGLNLAKSLGEKERDDFEDEVIALLGRMNRSQDETLLVPQEYLEAVAVKTGTDF